MEKGYLTEQSEMEIAQPLSCLLKFLTAAQSTELMGVL
jgi:hypothetical protein